LQCACARLGCSSTPPAARRHPWRRNACPLPAVTCRVKGIWLNQQPCTLHLCCARQSRRGCSPPSPQRLNADTSS
jgi:hypothetical protein